MSALSSLFYPRCLVSTARLVQVRLWVHESFHVFGDRLVNDTDRGVVLSLIRDLTRSVFSYDFESLFRHLDFNRDGMVELADLRHLIFCSIDVQSPEVTAASDGSTGSVTVYDEVLPIGVRTGDDTVLRCGSVCTPFGCLERVAVPCMVWCVHVEVSLPNRCGVLLLLSLSHTLPFSCPPHVYPCVTTMPDRSAVMGCLLRLARVLRLQLERPCVPSRSRCKASWLTTT